MGNFLFFALLSLSLLGVRSKSDKRDKYLHHGGWAVKLLLWLVFNALPFLFPTPLVNAYGWMARFGSGLFLCMQMVILLDFTQTLNDSWVAMEDERYLWGLLGLTCGAFAGAAALTGVLFYWFNPSGFDCSFNITIIVVSLIICLGFSLLSLHPQAENGSLFPSACITLYCMYLCYSALQSEPHDYACNALGKKISTASGTTLALGMVIALLSVVYSALRAGSNTQTFMTSSQQAAAPLISREEEGTSAGLDGEDDDVAGRRKASAADAEEDEPVSYNYSFFHLVFALASMYIAMLMTGWGTSAEEKDLMDVGWTSVWVKVVSQWATAGLYAWTLAAPLFFPDRDFSL